MELYSLNTMEMMRTLKQNYLKNFKTRKAIFILKNFNWIAILSKLATVFVPMIDSNIASFKIKSIFLLVSVCKLWLMILFQIKLKKLRIQNKKINLKKFKTQILFTWITVKKFNLYKNKNYFLTKMSLFIAINKKWNLQ